MLFHGYRWDNIPEERGWIRALAESHILFDEVHVTAIKPDSAFQKYKAIILPEILSIPDWLAKKLDEYAATGGIVIASGQTAKFDGNYEVSKYYPLRCMGVRKVNYVRDDMVSAMLHVEPSDLSVFPSYENDRVLYFGDTFVFAEYEDNVQGYLRLIPPHPYGPPERCYYQNITDIAGIHIHPYGQGKGILIPWNPGLLFYRDGYSNTFRFMRDLLIHAAGLESVENQPFTGMVEVTVGEERNSWHMLVQLINQTGHFGTSFLPPVLVRNISLKIPCKQQPSRVISQTTGKEIPFTWEHKKLRINVDIEQCFEGILVKLI